MIEGLLGPSVRLLREQRALSLRALADLTGFSPSFLSQVENGQASPSIASMERIAAALGVTLAEFFRAAEASPQPAVVRRSERRRLDSGWSRAHLEALSSGGARLDALLVVLDPGGASGAPATAPADEFALVLEGTLIVTVGETEHVLGVDDSISIRAGVGRRWRNESASPVRFLVVAARA
jgi:transcriptional regulator with XRE-family HTH domain